VSVFIPIYKESGLLEPLLNVLLKDPYQSKEIFVVIDAPTKKSLNLADKLKEKVNFIFNGHRMGKVNALNEAVKKSSGDIFVFLDGDVEINNFHENFLENIVKEMENVDILEIKKEVIKDSFLAKLVYYDYMSSNVVSWFFSKTLGKSLGLNGSAFAIKRKAFEDLGGFRRVVAEDLDLATRSFFKNQKFKYAKNVEVSVKTFSKWKQLYKQRKRWGIGGALWVKEYYKELIKTAIKFPKFLIPILPVIFPSLALFLISFLPSNTFYYETFMMLMLFMATKIGFLSHPFFLTFVGVALLKNLMASILSFGCFCVIFYFLAKKLDYTFNPLEFFLFYFIFSPFWLSIVIVSLVKVFIQPHKIKLDWKY